MFKRPLTTRQVVVGAALGGIALTIGASVSHRCGGRARPAPVLERAQSAAPADLDAYVERVMKTSRCPGSRSPSSRTARSSSRRATACASWASRHVWTAQTLFGIASNTKVFTAVALGLLVEEGKIAWDAPVIRYLPWFRLSDPYVTSELTVRDLLVHRSGLGLAPATCSGGRLRRIREARSRAGSRTFRSPRAFAAPTRTTTCCT